MPRGLQIAFFGSSLVSAYWNGAVTYYRGILKALHRRGHRIVFYEPDAYDRQEHRDVETIDYAESVVYPAASEDDALAAVEQARGADVVVKASGVGVFDAFLEKAVLEVRKRGTLVLFWDVDAPATLERVQSDPADPFRQLIPRYDAILTYGGGQPVIDAYRALGARECVPIYNALDPETHFPGEPRGDFEASLGFLGNRMPDREARVEEFFLKPARLRPDRRFLLGGSGWGDLAPRYPNLAYCGHVYTSDHNSFNSTPLAVLNVNRESMARFGFSPPTRIFEAAGAGACLLVDAWEGLDLFLTPGEECLTVGDGEQVAAALDLLDRDRAGRLGRAARRRVLAEHTYAHRAVEVERALDGESRR